jgi:ATPase subunit of ABC transporter with duplicated ATPase domains
MKKQCTLCKIEKNFANFHQEKSRKDGFHPWCKQCKGERQKSYYENNKPEILERQAKYQKNNEQKIKDASKVRAKRNYDKDPKKSVQRVLDYIKKNPQKNAERSAMHRAILLQATPPWADRRLIEEVYEFAVEFKEFGFDVHVDHIVPLKGKNVCGLHVQKNLRVCLAVINLSKGNKYVDGLYA